MAEEWLTIVGLGEDGPEGLSHASRTALDSAEVIMGPDRHLALIPSTGAERITWPVPFADGLAVLEGLRGRQVVVLASGDPFWFGAGSVIARKFAPGEWRAFSGPSAFSLAASRLGWPLEDTLCLGLHAAPFARLRPHLARGRRAIVTLRDGEAVPALADFLDRAGFGQTTVHVLEALGGLRERRRRTIAADCKVTDACHPVVVALDVTGPGGLSPASGKPDRTFESDGQITKRPIRALTLSTLAPMPGEMLWDIGAGSGSVALEWLMSHPSTQAVAIESRDDRAARIARNADVLGQDRLTVVCGSAPDGLADLPVPQAVFVGGGLSRRLLDWLTDSLAPGTRLVANAVTLDTEAIVIEAQARLGGELMRIEISEAQPLGRFRGWKAGYPLVQWNVTL